MCKHAPTHSRPHTHREIQNVHTISHCMYLKVNHFLGSRGFGILAIIVDFQLFLPDLFLCVSYRHTNKYKINYEWLSFYSLQNKFLLCNLYHTHTSIFIHSQINIKNVNYYTSTMINCKAVQYWFMKCPSRPPHPLQSTFTKHLHSTSKWKVYKQRKTSPPPQKKKRQQFRQQLWWTDASTPVTLCPTKQQRKTSSKPHPKKKRERVNNPTSLCFDYLLSFLSISSQRRTSFTNFLWKALTLGFN